MKKLKYLLIIFLMLFSSNEIAAQKDTIAQQRTARKMLRQGNELYQKEQFTDASVAYQKALGSNSNYDKASYNLGNALYKNKNYKEAIPQYELTAKTATDKAVKAEAFHNMGNSMMESKNYQGAVDAFKSALRNNPADDETRYNLAVAQQLLDKEKQDKKDDKNKDKDKTKIRRIKKIRTIRTKIKKTRIKRRKTIRTKTVKGIKTRIKNKTLKKIKRKNHKNQNHNPVK